jgi:3-hydroxyisobutyrate dehydrogenase-like beta-hydroxyacid dehydrogenase
MGFPMASHIANKIHSALYVFNRTERKEKIFIAEHGGYSLRQLERKDNFFDLMILCLKDDNAILEVLFEQGFVDFLKPKGIIIDHSTTSLSLVDSIKNNEKVISKNIEFLDAPVSGGEAGATKGVLSAMVGGNKTSLDKHQETLNAYTKSIVHIGPNGHGQISKMINQICISGVLQGLSEAIEFGKKQNVDMHKVIEAISGGAAQSWQLENRATTMLEDKFDFGFAIDLMIKDLEIIKSSNPNDATKLSLAMDVLARYKALSKKGFGKLDTSVLIKSLQD